MKSYHYPMFRKTYVTLLAAFLLAAFSSAAQIKELKVKAFESGIDDSAAQILDVRTLEEFNSGHIKGAMLADWTDAREFGRRIQALDKNRPVYIYCLSGGRSSTAGEKLRKLGFREVYHLDGGIRSWKEADYPLEGLLEAKVITLQEYRSLLHPDLATLVDIGAPWCPPCKRMDPVIDELVQSHGSRFRLVHIDGSQQEALMTELEASILPTFIIYKGGKEVWRGFGILSKEELLLHL